MAVRYIAIDAAFPHPLNSFDNVPVNYGNGALTNITTPSPTTKTYRNTINFTDHSISTGQGSYSTFKAPYTNNKILIFLTSLFEEGMLDASPPHYPLNLSVVITILTSQTY